MSNTEAFRAAIAAAGLTPPDEIVGGKLTRFSTNGKRSDDAGWYVFHDDERAAGRFGCNRSGVDATWRAEQRREFTAEERRAWAERMRALELEREAERQAATARAACLAEEAAALEAEESLSLQRSSAVPAALPLQAHAGLPQRAPLEEWGGKGQK
jgi:putative DNA primase/helicase